MSSGISADPQSERGNACPKNKFGLTDYRELESIEKAFSFKRATQLEQLGVTGKFNVAYLKSIHRHLFQDVFPWAGEFRVVNISKGNGRTQREFLRQLALMAGRPLSWAGFTQEEMVAASIRSHASGDHSQLVSILERAMGGNA